MITTRKPALSDALYERLMDIKASLILFDDNIRDIPEPDVSDAARAWLLENTQELINSI